MGTTGPLPRGIARLGRGADHPPHLALRSRTSRNCFTSPRCTTGTAELYKFYPQYSVCYINRCDLLSQWWEGWGINYVRSASRKCVGQCCDMKVGECIDLAPSPVTEHKL